MSSPLYSNEADAAVADLPNVGSLTGTELFYADTGTADVNVTASQVKTFAKEGLSAGDVSGLGSFATGTDAANLTGTIDNARLSAVPNSALANSIVTISGHALALGGTLSLVPGDVGLGNVTNDAQTKASVVPNTAPTAGQLLVGNTGGTAYAPVAVSGDATLSSAGVASVTKTGGVAFGNAATKNVGTTAGTVAAGDDSRITGAAQKASNLSDLASAATARTNLGLGTAATQNTGTSAFNVVQLDASAKLPAVDGSQLTNIAAPASVPQNFLTGLTLSNNAVDAVHDIDIDAGVCADSTNTAMITLASPITKRLDANWAVGTNAGGLDTGTATNGATYHVFLIQRSDTGVVDALFSTNATAPTMPTSYNRKRRIGSIINSSTGIRAFVQDGDKFKLVTPVPDVNGVASYNPSFATSGVAQAITVASGVRVEAFGIVSLNVDGNCNLVITDLSTDDINPLTGVNSMLRVSTSAVTGGCRWQENTNASAQIRVRCSASGTGKFVYLLTQGWYDSRGR